MATALTAIRRDSGTARWAQAAVAATVERSGWLHGHLTAGDDECGKLSVGLDSDHRQPIMYIMSF